MLLPRNHPSLNQDLRALETKALFEVLRIMGELEEDRPQRAKPLGKSRTTGNLKGCWAIKFDDPAIALNRYRLIYRYLPNDWFRETVEFLAVGPRFEFEVYKKALDRLD